MYANLLNRVGVYFNSIELGDVYGIFNVLSLKLFLTLVSMSYFISMYDLLTLDDISNC